jgi:23S rRNA pseudouridine2605 synthase
MAASVRLQRYLATAGIAARRKAEELITAGRVTVNGAVVTVLGSKVDPERDSVEVDGEAVVALEHFYVLFNKPKACITAVTDDRGRPTVMDYLPNLPVPVKPVGRLDFYSEGVLLLTNDGELASRLLAPASHVPKTYHVKVHGRLERAELTGLRDGITLDDGTTTLPAEIEVLPGESKHTWLGITIHEGKHRQIHRMIEALGHRVDKLQRVAFANLTFHELRVGDARELTQQELNGLRDMVGLDHSAVARGKWRARREATDIPRRARARARAEQEAAAAESGAALEPNEAPSGGLRSIASAIPQSQRSSVGRGDDSAQSWDRAGSHDTHSTDAPSTGRKPRATGTYSGRGDDSAESWDRAGSRGARSQGAPSAAGGRPGRGAYSGRGDDSAESLGRTGSQGAPSAGGGRRGRGSYSSRGDDLAESRPNRSSRGAKWGAPLQSARPSAAGGRPGRGSYSGRGDDSAESRDRAGSRGARSQSAPSAAGGRPGRGAYSSRGGDSAESRGRAGSRGPRSQDARSGDGSRRGSARGAGPQAGGQRVARDSASASRGAGSPAGRAARDAGRAGPGNRDRRERELGVESGGGRRRGFGPRVPRRGGRS